MTAFTLPIDSPAAALGRVGGKGANLSALARAGLPVPDGFHVTIDAYRAFVKAHDLEPKIHRLLDSAQPDDSAGLDAAAHGIRVLFEVGTIPDEIVEEVGRAYQRLRYRPKEPAEPEGPERRNLYTSGPSVAVRSSASAEDLSEASFAGQHDTYLNIVGEAAVLMAVKKCWGSLWTVRAIAYRRRNGIRPEDMAMAVIVQELVPAEVSGILLTANPVTGNRTEVIIDAARGLGEAIVGGKVMPDHWVVDKATGQIKERRISEKQVVTAQRDGGTSEIRMDESQSRRPALAEAHIAELVRMGREIEAHFQAPQDIEWVLANDRLYIVQSRPITSLFPLPDNLPPTGEVHVYLSFNSGEGMLEPFTPMGLSIFREIARLATRTFGVNIDGQVHEVAGRIYRDVTPAIRGPRASRVLLSLSTLELRDPLAARAVRRLKADPRIVSSERLMRGHIARLLPRFVGILGCLCVRALGAWLNPDRARVRGLARVERAINEAKQQATLPRTLVERVEALEDILSDGLPPILLSIVLVVPGVLAQQLVRWLSRRWLGDDRESVSLLCGLPHNPTSEMNRALRQLSRQVAADSASRQVVLNKPPATLAECYREGCLPPAAQAGLAVFLDTYGHRGVREIDVGIPRWSEDPTYVLNIIRNYLALDDLDLAPDMHFEESRWAAEAAAQQLIERVRTTAWSALKAYLITGAIVRLHALSGLRESPRFNFVRLLQILRSVLKEIGHDLQVAGQIDRHEDVFFLSLDEIRAYVRGEQRNGRLADPVLERRRTYERELGRRRIPRLITSEGVTIYGDETAEGNALAGMPVSPGVVEGSVRVILDPHGAHLEPGEILVTPSTDPAWTPLFLIAGGLVMEAGGMLSHGSVIARECDIPAVVSVPNATHLLKTGQRVIVDGNAGRVVLKDGGEV